MTYTINHTSMTEPFDKLSNHLQDCCGGCPYCVELCQQVLDEANGGEMSSCCGKPVTSHRSCPQCWEYIEPKYVKPPA